MKKSKIHPGQYQYTNYDNYEIGRGGDVYEHTININRYGKIHQIIDMDAPEHEENQYKCETIEELKELINTKILECQTELNQLRKFSKQLNQPKLTLAE